MSEQVNSDVSSEDPPSTQKLAQSQLSTERPEEAGSSPLSSPPPRSSPPVAGDLEFAKADMPAVTKNSSSDDTGPDTEEINDSSATAIDDHAQDLSQVKPGKEDASSSAATILPSTPAHTMLPPPASLLSNTQPKTASMPPPSTKPQKSSEGSTTRSGSQLQAAKIGQSTDGQTRKHSRDSASEAETDDGDSAGSSTPGEPQDRIDDFDWGDLEQRYHRKMNELGAVEQGIYEDFNSLCNAGYPLNPKAAYMIADPRNSTLLSGLPQPRTTRSTGASSGKTSLLYQRL